MGETNSETNGELHPKQQDKRLQKTRRRIVSKRLRTFYSTLVGFMEVDAEGFYNRVMQQTHGSIKHGG